MKTRLDIEVARRGLAMSRSQAESWIRLGRVEVNGRVETKPGKFVDESVAIILTAEEQYVSRAALKLASVSKLLGLNFRNVVALDVGSSTGGFTDYALRQGAKKVIAVDVGTDQLHPSLRGDNRIELHEKTDIRDFRMSRGTPDIVMIDVSFISLRDILPYLAENICGSNTVIAAMVKPQFEAGKGQTNKGIIKNDAVRRQILKDFELWAKRYFIIEDKHDSDVAGSKGNRERFYRLKIITH